MPTVEELFEEMGAEPYVDETEERAYCVIDPITREIEVPERYQLLGVESDEKVERIWFQCPKVVGDNVDLTKFQLRINYQNANAEKDQYIVEDVTDTGDGNIVFSWLLSRKVTNYMGVVQFIVCAVKVDSNTLAVTNEWNTTLGQADVLVGLEVEPRELTEEESDVIAQLLEIMSTTSAQAVEDVEDARQGALTDVATAKNSAQESIEEYTNDLIDTLPGDYTELYEISEETARKIEQIRTAIAYQNIGFDFDSHIVGLEVDYEEKTFTRLMGAVGKEGGADFNQFYPFGGRRRCNLADNGTILAWHGDESYKEDGSNGQVMVFQPKFYYMVVPIKLEKTTGEGYHGRKMQYYVSDLPASGFKLHPAFCMGGKEVDYIFLSAYEGTIYDASESTYILDDAQIVDFEADLLCSISGARPASGKTQQLTRQNVEKIAQNRGVGWHGEFLQSASVDQFLFMIEYGMANSQTALGNGIVSIPDTDSTTNNSLNTGGTSSLGNTSGAQSGASGQTAVSYRGKENPWGNIWKFVYGINVWGDGTKGGGVPYICSDFNFSESKNTDNYKKMKMQLANASGYISAFGYDADFDWVFLTSEALGNSSTPVGDNCYVTSNLMGYRIALLGGYWGDGLAAGLFYWSLGSGVGGRARFIGCRAVYVPTV